MPTNPTNFVTNFLAQPWPTMGMAPSSVPIKSGGTVVQAGSGSDGIGKTSASMWARIASAVPFGWSLFGADPIIQAGSAAKTYVTEKVKAGAQAVEGKVTSAVSGVTSTLKWTIVAAGIILVVFVIAQFKSLFPRGN